MEENEIMQSLLRRLPAIDHIIELSKTDSFLQNVSKVVLVKCARAHLENLRRSILEAGRDFPQSRLDEKQIIAELTGVVTKLMRPSLSQTINATGIVVHTNLGRSILCRQAIDHLVTIAGSYSNLEFDLAAGKRGTRYSHVESLLCELSGAEAALVVNNNAGAVFLCLETLARGKKVIISRGELVEIGGSFRIPDVMAKSGAILAEVGTTNRTHLKDYERAVDGDTGLLLKVHQSNFSIEGFTTAVSLKMLVDLGKKLNLPVMEDLGSGTFIDFSKYGLAKEPTVQESVATGPDVVTFSGDKLLGGPQTGIVVGKKKLLDRIKNNPITRALRVDKLTLAALEATLSLYRDEKTAVETIPTLRMLTESTDAVRSRAKQLADMLGALKEPTLETRMMELSSRVGGGALPQLALPTVCLGIRIRGASTNTVELNMRSSHPPIIGRIEEDFFVMDLRTVATDELSFICTAIANLLSRT